MTEPASPASTRRFADAYRDLQQAVQRIESASEDDLDAVIEGVRAAKAAKAECDARIKAATEELDTLLRDDADRS